MIENVKIIEMNKLLELIIIVAIKIEIGSKVCR